MRNPFGASIEKIRQMRAEVIRLNLARPTLFDCLTDEDLAAIYNGYGPDAWPEQLRDIITFVYRWYTLLPLIHDVEFRFSDGTWEGWHNTCVNWEHNMWVMYAQKFPDRPHWYELRLKAHMWYDRKKLKLSLSLLKKFSWNAWTNCADINLQPESKRC